MYFDESGVGEMVFGCVHSGIKPFDVTDLEDAAASLGRSDQRIGLSECCGDRFFNQQMNVLLKEFQADRRMQGGGDGEADRIDLPQELFRVLIGLTAQLLRKRSGARWVTIADRAQAHLGHRGINFSVPGS